MVKKRKMRPVPTRRPTLAKQPYSIKEGVTQSLLSSFVDCRMRCRLYLDGWQPAGRTKESLHYGSLFHFMLERLGKGVMAGETSRAAYQCGGVWWDANVGMFRALQPADADASLLQLTEQCVAQAMGVWDGYLTRYPKDLDADRWLELEGVFDVDWSGYRLRGKRDGMLRDAKGNLWLFETKTKSQISDDTVASTLAFDFQSLFYLTANQAELKARGEKAKLVGVRYNVIRKPQHKLKVGESLADYSDRIADDVAKRPDHWFFRYEARYGKKTLEEFQGQLLAKLQTFEQWSSNRDSVSGADDLLRSTYRNEAACQKRWNCRYISWCAGARQEYEQTGRLFVELEE